MTSRSGFNPDNFFCSLPEFLCPDLTITNLPPCMDSARPKIVFLTNMLSGGGAERSLLETFRALDRQRFDRVLWRLEPLNVYPEYLTDPASTEVLSALPQDRASLARVRSCRAMVPPYLEKAHARELVTDGLRLCDRLRRLLAEVSQPVVLVGSQLSMNIRVAVAQWLCGYRVPAVFVEQNEPYLRYAIGENPKTRDVAWARIRGMYPQADHVVAVSQAAKRSLVARFGLKPKSVSVIPNPVNVARVREYLERPRPAHPFFHARAPVLLCTARFFLQKNHALLLRSFALARQKVPAKLILLGHGPLQEPIQRTIAEMELGRDVALIDFHSDPFSFIAHADLFVLASYCEGHSLALLESLACGVPVVSTKWPGVAEIIQQGRNGIITEMTDAALAAGILAGLQLKQSPAARAAAVASAQRCDAARIAAKYEKLFWSLIDRRPAAQLAITTSV
jgi:glycosyltransferase involved in cell wall biosynthesis